METILERVENRLLEKFKETVGYQGTIISSRCESPIEIALALAMVGHSRVIRRGPSLEFVDQEYEERFADLAPLLIPQYEWQGKRIDFKYIDKPVEIFIECDGHDFHERTAYQATRDRRKDRLIQSVGIPILRFTGSEIYHDAMDCAAEIFYFADTRRVEPTTNDILSTRRLGGWDV